MDSDASFNTTVKHFFRHLHEARFLRKNPLALRFFENIAIHGFGSARDRAVLKHIHDILRKGAEHCRNADLANGNDEQALRQYAIMTLQCLDQLPLQTVAAKLGISPSHCYRERAKICRRVARYLCRYEEPAMVSLPEVDELQVLIHRALHHAALSDMITAFHECEELVAAAPPGYQKLEALRISAFIAMRFGMIKRAEDAFIAAKSLSAKYRADETLPSRDIAAACVDLLAAQLAYYRGHAAQAYRMARRAAKCLEKYQGNAPAHVRELYAEALDELGSALCNLGDWEQGAEEYANAEAQLSRMRTASSSLHARVALGLWKVRSYLPNNSQNWYPLWKRTEGLAKTFEQAFSSGFLFEATAAILALTEHYALTGNALETLRAGRCAMLLINRQPSERIRVQTSINLSIQFLLAEHWERAHEVLPSPPQLDLCDAYHRQLATYLSAMRALRLGDPRKAWSLATMGSDRKEYATLAARKLLIAASSAYEMGNRRDAHTLVDLVIAQAEQIGLAMLLRDTYRVAAVVKGSRRYRHLAQELASAITA